MSKGLGKIEKEILRICSRCYFSKEEILESKKPRKYPGGIRFLHHGSGEYFRGLSFGRGQYRMRLDNENQIDLKEVHYLYRKKFGKSSLDKLNDFTGNKQGRPNMEKTEEIFEEVGPMFGMKFPFTRGLSASQEASYQRGVHSLLRKNYLEIAGYGLPGKPGRFVCINQNKIKPKKPKRYKGNHNT